MDWIRVRTRPRVERRKRVGRDALLRCRVAVRDIGRVITTGIAGNGAYSGEFRRIRSTRTLEASPTVSELDGRQAQGYRLEA